METEQLKIIMDTLASLGASGKEGFIWWLVMKYGLHYVTVIAFLVAAVAAIRTVMSVISKNTHGNQLGLELSKMLKTSESEYRGWDSESYRASTKAEIINKVRDLMAAKPS